MKASDYIVKTLAEHDVSKVFGYIGGMVAHLADSLYLSSNVEMINTIHEQGAGFAAEGYARTTGKIGVAIATSGPGATNLLTPIASCFFDSTPVLFITGQVNTFEYRKHPGVRQCGFQETNIVNVASPITKYAVLVDKVENLRYELEKALFHLTNARKGPVLLDIPMDIQRQEFDFETASSFLPDKDLHCLDNDTLQSIANQLIRAQRPLILVGNGVRLSNAIDLLNRFLNQTQIPVVQSLLGIDAAPSSYPYNLGMIGTYGNRAANLALANADVVLVLGSRMDVRQIGAKPDAMFNNTSIIQIDIDYHEVACNQIKKSAFQADIKSFLTDLSTFDIKPNMTKWQNKIMNLRAKYPSTKNLEASDLIPNKIIEQISLALLPNDVICADVGQHQMWVGQSVWIQKNTRVLSSGGLGSMGFALPCALGVAITGRRAVVISGDGGFQMNIQELEVIKRRNLPVKMIVMNNHALGMVRGFQELYFERRFASTINDYSVPDFVEVAKAYGIESSQINAGEITTDYIGKFLLGDHPALLNIHLDTFSQVEPKVLFGNSLENMSPLLPSDEMEKAMNNE